MPDHVESADGRNASASDAQISCSISESSNGDGKLETKTGVVMSQHSRFRTQDSELMIRDSEFRTQIS